MAIAERELTSLLADKDELRRLMAEQNRLIGVTPDPTATVEKAQAMRLALGIRPEGNIFSKASSRRENSRGITWLLLSVT